VTDEVNEYEEDIERVVGIYAPHLGAHRVHVTRTAEWRIVPKILAVEPLTLKSGSAAPRSPVNNCGKLAGGGDPVMTPTPSEQAAAVLNLIERGVCDWDEPEVVKVLRGALKAGAQLKSRQRKRNGPLKTSELAPSARMTKTERDRIAKIRFDLAKKGIIPECWELQAMARGATVTFEGQKFSYDAPDRWLLDSK
jgi:large subunit ribosomal protein L30